ncbi:hypothetical protein H0X06_03350 [Candidatus Dependentiae bacterium]|nr:hypothetical protein [Candidatus Dependentiae bacterium]
MIFTMITNNLYNNLYRWDRSLDERGTLDLSVAWPIFKALKEAEALT